jgi:PIN domain nuclease of toxin-antitoxin system
MRVLLDTHAFLWWVMNDQRLSETARQVIEDGAND